MVTVRFLQDYGNYKKGQTSQVESAKTLQKLIGKGIIEVVKAKAETAVTPQAETAIKVTPTAKKAKKK